MRGSNRSRKLINGVSQARQRTTPWTAGVGPSSTARARIEVNCPGWGQERRDRGIGALAHRHIGQGENNLPIAFDADEGVGREAIGVGRFG